MCPTGYNNIIPLASLHILNNLFVYSELSRRKNNRKKYRKGGGYSKKTYNFLATDFWQASKRRTTIICYQVDRTTKSCSIIRRRLVFC